MPYIIRNGKIIKVGAAKRRTKVRRVVKRRVSYKSPNALVAVRKQSERLSSTRNTKKQAYNDYKKMVVFVKEKFNKPLGKAYWHKDWAAFHKIKKARAPYLKMLKTLKDKYKKAAAHTSKENWKLRRAQVARQISIHGEEGYKKKRMAKTEARIKDRMMNRMDQLVARGMSPEQAAKRAAQEMTMSGMSGIMNYEKLQAMQSAGLA